MDNYEFVTHTQYDRAFKRIESANLKTNGRSLTATSMRMLVVYLVSEVRDEGVFVRKGWRQEIKQRFLVQQA